MGVAQKDILNGWKEIAGYVARDIRTVERWEKQRGLPVRRVPGAGRATVYARISELEEWLASKPLDSDSSSTVTAQPSATATVADDESPVGRLAVDASFDHPMSDSRAVEQPALPARRTVFYSAVAASLIVVMVGIVYMRHSQAAAASSGTPEIANSHLAVPRSSVPGVDESFLRGSYLYEQRTPESLSQAVDSFNSAIEHDPSFAPAYAGLANTYNLLREYSVMPNEQAYPKAREAAERAIALNPKLAEAHAALGFVTYFWYMDAARAEREFKTAVALDSTSAEARHWYGTMLTHEGRFAEALQELDTAQHLQPASSAILTSRAFALGLSGHAEQARTMLRDLLSHNGFGKDPNSATTHLVLGVISTAEPRDWDAQFTQWREIAALGQKKPALLSYVNAVEPAYKRGGEAALWRASLVYEMAQHPAPGDVTLRMAQAEANLGHADAAFRYLNALADRHDAALVGVSLDPLLAPLRADPRFTQFRARLGLPKLNA